MADEIERKFLVRSDGWKADARRSRQIVQAYVALDGPASVRVRIVDGAHAMLTIKSRKAEMRRSEFEYEIPVADARTLLEMRTGTVIEKVRYELQSGPLTWEVDVFSGENEGLVIAEIELQHEDQELERPDWLGEEITSDDRYYNASLAKHPFRRPTGA
jgi:adenylate cyclase